MINNIIMKYSRLYVVCRNSRNVRVNFYSVNFNTNEYSFHISCLNKSGQFSYTVQLCDAEINKWRSMPNKDDYILLAKKTSKKRNKYKNT